MKKVTKGNPGYIRYEQKKRTLITILLFRISLLVFFTGLIQTGTRKNLFTLVAILGVLPAAKAAVNMIMVLLQKPADPDLVEETKKRAAGLVTSFEMTVTAYEGSMPIDALVVCGNQVACFSSRGKKEKTGFMEKHMADILKGNGYLSVNVKIFQDRKHFLERVDQLAKAPDKYREGISFTPDERYPDLSREELIKHVLLAISV